MSFEPTPFEPKIERRRGILYGTPGTAIYRGGRPVLWVPDDFGSLTKHLSYKDLEALQKELKKYLQSASRDGRVNYFQAHTLLRDCLVCLEAPGQEMRAPLHP